MDLVQTIVLWAVPVVFAITLHEAAHGYVARMFGDQTAWMLGRVTLNPIKHIDPIGTIAVPGALLDNWQYRIVKQGVPGSYTFLLPATREVPRRLKHPRRSSIGVRVPEHAVVQALLAELEEPILSSTLIPPGAAEPLNDPNEIRARYEHLLDLIVDSGACHLEPTTVVDLAISPPEVTRLGRGDPARLGLAIPAA